MNRVVLLKRSGVVRLEVWLDALRVEVNPEMGKPVASVAMRLAKKLRQKEASFVKADGCLVDGDCAQLETGDLLKVGDATLPLFVNPALARDLAIPGYPMVGLPILPIVVLENTDAAEWVWLRGDEVVGIERIFVPTAKDLGTTVRCEITPHPGGVTVSAESDVVGAAPPMAVPATPPPCGDFRLLTYNLLADYNVKADVARGDPDILRLRPEDRDIQYRRQLLLRDIMRCGSDILCFQEVDRDAMYANFLLGQLEHLGYDGVYANKVHTSTPLGNAVFWRRSSWRLATSEVLDLTQGEAIQSLLEACPSLGFAMSKTTTVANLVVLENGAKRLVVANLHLFGDPGAPHIRLLQTYLVLHAAERYAAPLLFCGDFNCGPESGVCELLSVGFVEEGHPDWIVGRGFVWGALCEKRADLASIPEDQWCAAMPLSHSFSLQTAGVPDYTYWNGYRGWVVDHIFLDAKALRVQCMLPVTPVAVARECGVPSSAFPSDHAALIADLCWTDG